MVFYSDTGLILVQLSRIMISTWTKIDPTQNCFRFYAVSLASDLFNAYVVSCEWGRIGAKRYHRKVDVFTSFDEANGSSQTN
jgi:predicted DNA-binding WGR domain protein